ncbi:MAG: FlgD immunoglobulin-like domain containing protein, partial [Armatimonadia bacterium]
QITADGRYVAFMSTSQDLVANDTIGWYDIFLRNCATGHLTLISVATSGAQGNDDSSEPSISADGRYVAFTSLSTNLVNADTAVPGQVYVRDLVGHTTTRVSVSSAGVAGDGWSHVPSISPDGRYVAFQSEATNLVPGDTNGKWDIFVHDRSTGTTSRVSVSTGGTQGNWDSWEPSISKDGRYVAFESGANNLVSGDTNSVWDVFVRDRVSNVTTRVSVNETGGQGAFESVSASISPDGRYVAFASEASLVTGDTNQSQDVFIRDRVANQTKRLSLNTAGTQGNGASGRPALSANSRWIAFLSIASNLVTGDANGVEDVFVRDTGAVNALPTAPTTLTLNPSAPGREDIKTIVGGSTDANGDKLTYQCKWAKQNGDGTWGAWSYTSRTLPAAQVAIGQTWRVRARAYDGIGYGSYGAIKTFTIVGLGGFTPAPSTRGVAVSTCMFVSFRWPVKQCSVTSRVQLKRGTTVVPTTMTWVTAERKVKLRPKTPLLPGTYYRMNVDPGIECTSGRVLGWGENYWFETAASSGAVSVAAAPTAAGAQVTVNLSAAATVRTVICNIAGRVVAELAERELPAGVNSLVWNGRGNGGSKVPAGTYLVKVEAKGAEGTQTTAVTSLQIR